MKTHRCGNVIIGLALALTLGTGCASTRFDRQLDAQQWAKAASTFDADPSLQRDESTLFRAAMLYSFPTRNTYNPARARDLFKRFLTMFPQSSMRQSALDHLALLDEVQRTSASAGRQRELELRLGQLSADTARLRARLDSVTTRLQAEQDQTSVLRKVANRLEGDLQDRENQIHTLTDELKRLKEIDLRTPVRPKPVDTTGATKKAPGR